MGLFLRTFILVTLLFILYPGVWSRRGFGGGGFRRGGGGGGFRGYGGGMRRPSYGGGMRPHYRPSYGGGSRFSNAYRRPIGSLTGNYGRYNGYSHRPSYSYNSRPIGGGYRNRYNYRRPYLGGAGGYGLGMGLGMGGMYDPYYYNSYPYGGMMGGYGDPYSYGAYPPYGDYYPGYGVAPPLSPPVTNIVQQPTSVYQPITNIANSETNNLNILPPGTEDLSGVNDPSLLPVEQQPPLPITQQTQIPQGSLSTDIRQDLFTNADDGTVLDLDAVENSQNGNPPELDVRTNF